MAKDAVNRDSSHAKWERRQTGCFYIVRHGQGSAHLSQKRARGRWPTSDVKAIRCYLVLLLQVPIAIAMACCYKYLGTCSIRYYPR